MDSVSETKEYLLQSLTEYRAVACQMNARNKTLEEQIKTLQHEVSLFVFVLNALHNFKSITAFYEVLLH